MNARTRRVTLHAIAVIAVLASINALAHSYAGLYGWARHHDLTGWQAASWPAEIDVFLAIGELALYLAYLDTWPTRHKTWPWASALIGLAVSVAGNIGRIQPAAVSRPLSPTVSPPRPARSPHSPDWPSRYSSYGWAASPRSRRRWRGRSRTRPAGDRG